jgi:hypothetical protein
MKICMVTAVEVCSEETYQRAFAEGQGLTLDEAVALALEVTEK